jgi:hypothetical protein
MAGLDQIRRHGVPHDAQSHKCNSHADFSLSFLETFLKKT